MRRLVRRQGVEQATLIAHVLREGLVDQLASRPGERDHPPSAVGGRTAAGDQTVAFQPVDALGHGAGGDHGVRRQLAGGAFERRSRTAQRGEHIELPLAQAVPPVDEAELLREQPGETVESPDHTLGAYVDIGAFARPLGLNAGDVIKGLFRHDFTIASTEGIISSMEATLRWTLLTALAPVAWGTNYFVTHAFLPAGHPLYGAAIRALPAGLLLLAIGRERPHGSWWWKSLVLGVLNVGAFFALIYLAAQLLPTSVASTVMASSPLVMMVFAWALLAERPRLRSLAGAGVGIGGVCLMLLTGASSIDARGVLASVTAMAMSSWGYILAKRWSHQVDVLGATSWQLIAGGLVLLPVAVAVEGAPPTLDLPAALGFGYVTVVATALAFAVWFAGLRHLPAATVGLVGLLNPVTGVLLGTAIAGEALTIRQLGGLVLVLAGILLGQPLTRRARGTTTPPEGESQHHTNAAKDRPPRPTSRRPQT